MRGATPSEFVGRSRVWREHRVCTAMQLDRSCTSVISNLHHLIEYRIPQQQPSMYSHATVGNLTDRVGVPTAPGYSTVHSGNWKDGFYKRSLATHRIQLSEEHCNMQSTACTACDRGRALRHHTKFVQLYLHVYLYRGITRAYYHFNTKI